jgi:uncharacterized membrane protein YgcG
MRKLLLLGLICPLFISAQVLDPKPNTWVHDYSNTLTPQQVTNLNTKLSKLRNQTSIQFHVLLVSNLNNIDIESYANETFRKWGIGQKGLDNGLLYVICPSCRSARIEIGGGLEGDLADGEAKIIQYSVRSYYKDNNYYEGINLLIDKVFDEIGIIPWDQRIYNKQIPSEGAQSFVSLWLWVAIFIGFILIGLGWYYIRKNKKTKIQKARDIIGLKQYRNNLVKGIRYYLDTYKTTKNVTIDDLEKEAKRHSLSLLAEFNSARRWKTSFKALKLKYGNITPLALQDDKLESIHSELKTAAENHSKAVTNIKYAISTRATIELKSHYTPPIKTKDTKSSDVGAAIATAAVVAAASYSSRNEANDDSSSGLSSLLGAVSDSGGSFFDGGSSGGGGSTDNW